MIATSDLTAGHLADLAALAANPRTEENSSRQLDDAVDAYYRATKGAGHE